MSTEFANQVSDSHTGTRPVYIEQIDLHLIRALLSKRVKVSEIFTGIDVGLCRDFGEISECDRYLMSIYNWQNDTEVLD